MHKNGKMTLNEFIRDYSGPPYDDPNMVVDVAREVESDELTALVDQYVSSRNKLMAFLDGKFKEQCSTI